MGGWVGGSGLGWGWLGGEHLQSRLRLVNIIYDMLSTLY